MSNETQCETKQNSKQSKIQLDQFLVESDLERLSSGKKCDESYHETANIVLELVTNLQTK